MGVVARAGLDVCGSITWWECGQNEHGKYTGPSLRAGHTWLSRLCLGCQLLALGFQDLDQWPRLLVLN